MLVYMYQKDFFLLSIRFVEAGVFLFILCPFKCSFNAQLLNIFPKTNKKTKKNQVPIMPENNYAASEELKKEKKRV